MPVKPVLAAACPDYDAKFKAYNDAWDKAPKKLTASQQAKIDALYKAAKAAQANCDADQAKADETAAAAAAGSGPPAAGGAPTSGASTTATKGLINPLGSVTTVEGLVGRLVKVLLGLSGSVALLMFVWGGFQYLWSAGDPKKVEKGKETLKNAVLGLFIILFAYAAVNALINALSTGTIT